MHYEYKFHMILNFRRSLLQLDFLGTQDIMEITSSKVYLGLPDGLPRLYIHLLDRVTTQ